MKIDTELSTGNPGLDAEKKWRHKSGFCEHDWSYYVSDEKDIKNPMLCDFEDEEQDIDSSVAEKATKPNKHPAVEGAKDVAFICNMCHAVCCKNCYQEYPSDENTPVSDRGFLEEKNSPSNNKGTSEEKPKNSPSKSSLLDDFADTSSEMPDYTGGED